MAAVGGAIPRVRERVRLDPAQAALVLGSGIGMIGLYLLVKGSLIDDAYITLAYAKNVAFHLHWGLIPQETSNTATSPLNVLLLAAATVVTRDAVSALGVVSVAAAMVTAWAMLRVVRALGVSVAVAAVAVALIFCNPLVLSAVGLEVLLIPAVLIALLAMALEGRAGWFGIVAGLALLCRADLVVFVIAIGAAAPAVRTRWRRALAGAAVVAGPWFLFSWVALGSALPDTAIIKISQRQLFAPYSYVTGPIVYYLHRWTPVTVALLPALLGLLVLVTWLTVRWAVRWRPAEGPPGLGLPAALGVGGLLYWGLLAVLRVPPYHWYYVPPAIALSTFLVLAAAVWLRQARSDARLRAGVPAGVLAVAAVFALGALVRDVTNGLPWNSPLVTSNFADAGDYKRVALALRERVGSTAVAPAGEIGTIAYYCDCNVVDLFSDRGRAVALINRRISGEGPLTSIPWRLNYLFLDRSQEPRPIGYRLVYARGPGSGPNVWQVWSPWLGTGHITLVRAR